MRWRHLLVALIAASSFCAAAPLAQAGSASALCRKRVTDDALRPIPDSLVPTARKLFDLHAMPAAQIAHSTYFRCFRGQVLLCTVGANLPCGKADTRRDLPEPDAWCAEHPNADYIPMSVTGHATIYRWRCRGAKAAIDGRPAGLDARGFIADLWKRAGGER